jgi:hypothetical protein
MTDVEETLVKTHYYKKTTESVIPWAKMYFPKNACAACGYIGPSHFKNFIKLFEHLQLCTVYTEEEKIQGLEDWDSAYKGETYIPQPVLREGVPTSERTKILILNA